MKNLPVLPVEGNALVVDCAILAAHFNPAYLGFLPQIPQIFTERMGKTIHYDFLRLAIRVGGTISRGFSGVDHLNVKT